MFCIYPGDVFFPLNKDPMLIYNKSLDNVNTPIRTFLYYALLIQCFKSLNILFPMSMLKLLNYMSFSYQQSILVDDKFLLFSKLIVIFLSFMLRLI